jgi:hypothetical protein
VRTLHIAATVTALAAGLVIAGCGASTSTASTSTASTSTASATSSTATHSATATPRPTPTPNTELAYMTVVHDDSGTIGPLFTQVGTDASAGDLAVLRADVVTAQGAAEQFINDLATVKAPARWAVGDAKLRHGLALTDQACTQVLAGIDNVDAAQISAAATKLNQGTTLFQQAAAVFQQG